MLSFNTTKQGYRLKSGFISIGFGNGAIAIFAFSSVLILRKRKYAYLGLQDSFIICNYTIISVLLNFLFVLFRMNNELVNWIVNVILLFIHLILLLFILSSTTEIIEQLENDKVERNAFYNLKDGVEALLNKSSNRNINKLIEKLYDKINSCQINRNIDVSDIDLRIIKNLDDVKNFIENNSDEEIIKKQIVNTMKYVDERNRKIANFIKR